MDEIKKINEEIAKLNKTLGNKPLKVFEEADLKEAQAALRGLRADLKDITSDIGGIAVGFKSIVQEMQKSSVPLADAKKSFRGLSSLAQTLKNDQEGIEKLNQKQLSSIKEKIKKERENLKSTRDLLILKGRDNELSKEEKSALTEINGILQGNDGLYRGLLATSIERLKQEEKINDALGLGGQAIDGIGKALSKMGFGGLAGKLGLEDAKKKMKEVANEVTKGGTETVGFSGKMKVLKSGFSSMKGSLVSNLTDPLSVGVFLINEMFQALKGADKATGDLAYGMNMTYSEAASMRNELNSAANLSGSIYVNTKGMQESLLAINKSLGTSVSLNSKNLVTFTKFREAAHLSNEELMGMQSLAMATNGDLESMTGEFLAQAQLTATNNKAVLNEKQLLAEISKTSAATTLSLSKNPSLIADAAATAKSLGMEMSKVEGIAGSLLDFESSIESELQAELLLGKDINLEKARQAALNNDLATVAEEIAKQAGSAAEFGAMNRIQQDALAKSVGMSREELAKTLFVQEQIGNVSAEEAKIKEKYINDLQAKGLSQDEIKEKLANKSLKTLEKQSSMQTKLNKSVEKLREVFVSIAGPVMQLITPIVDLLIPALSAVSYILTPVSVIFQGIADTILYISNSISGFYDMLTGANTELSLMQSIVGAIAITYGLIASYNAAAAATSAIRAAMEKNSERSLIKQGFVMVKNLGIAIAEAVAKITGASAATLGIAAGIALAAGATAYAFLSSKGDDVMSPGAGSGYGSRTLLGPEGAISLNNKDTVIAGTDLFKPENKPQPQTPTDLFKPENKIQPQTPTDLFKPENKIQPQTPINTPPVVQQTVVQQSDNNESKKTNALLEQILTKQGTVKMDSVDVGTSFAMNTYEVQ
jgi:hypothetical protein